MLLKEVEKMRNKVEKLESEYLEQLHFEKMLALKWKLIAIGFIIVTLVSNIIWVSVWNRYEYTEEIISEDIITETITTTVEQNGDNNTMEGVDIY